jgi:hypothetical protein
MTWPWLIIAVSAFTPRGALLGSWSCWRQYAPNVLVDIALIPALLQEHGVEAELAPSGPKRYRLDFEW